MSIRRALFGLVVIPALAAGMTPSAAVAQTDQIPAVNVRPLGTTRNDPNAGQWFVVSLNPRQTKQLRIELFNRATVAQTVKLYLADLRFDKEGAPSLVDKPTDIATWGRLSSSSVSVGPRKTVVASLLITAPEGADPGDHIGAIVVEQAPAGTGDIRSIKRVAVRLYASLPGDARRDFVIDGVSAKKDSSFYARELTVTVQLRNTGRVRLEPTVQVDGAEAKGPELLMSRAVESYVVTRPVKFWGGPVRLRVDAESRSLGVAGPSRQLRVTVWVIPWHLLAMLVLAAGLYFLLRYALRKRGSKYRALQADLQRLERLLSQQNREARILEPAGNAEAPDAAIRGAIKQAKRAGDLRTAERLERKLARPAKRKTSPPGRKGPQKRP